MSPMSSLRLPASSRQSREDNRGALSGGISNHVSRLLLGNRGRGEGGIERQRGSRYRAYRGVGFKSITGGNYPVEPLNSRPPDHVRELGTVPNVEYVIVGVGRVPVRIGGCQYCMPSGVSTPREPDMITARAGDHLKVSRRERRGNLALRLRLNMKMNVVNPLLQDRVANVRFGRKLGQC